MLQVTVIIPTFKRPRLLERCLAAAVRQDLPATAYEIIVVDDAGGDPATLALVRAMNATSGLPALRYLPVHGRHGPAAARNRGWRAARGRIIAFTDDDCIPSPTWLREGLAAFANANVAAVWGRLHMPLRPLPTDYELNAWRLSHAEFVTANCFCRRAVLVAVGGLDEHFTAPWREDSDLFFTLLERGERVTQAPRAVVQHPIRPAPWGVSLAQQRKMVFDALLYKKHPRLYRARIRRTPPWNYYGICTALLAAVATAMAGEGLWSTAALALWATGTGRFFRARLRHTSRDLVHVAEMAVTSALIPPLAVFWRLAGAVRFRVAFL